MSSSTSSGRAGRTLPALRSWWHELLRSTPRALPSLRPRRRRVHVDLGRYLPGWALRLICAAVALGCVVLAGAGSTLTVIGALLALGLAARPLGAVPMVVLGFVAFVLTTAGGSGLRPGSFAVLAGTHLFVQLAAVLGPYGWSVRVELRALLAPARRYLPVQLAAQLVALVGALLTLGRLELAWAAPLAAVAVAALVVWLVPRIESPPAPAGRPPGLELRDEHPSGP
jgi:hypothetical protein